MYTRVYKCLACGRGFKRRFKDGSRSPHTKKHWCGGVAIKQRKPRNGRDGAMSVRVATMSVPQAGRAGMFEGGS